MRAIQKRRRRKRRLHILSGILVFLTVAYCGIGCITYLSSRLTGCSIQPARAKINAILKETDTYPEELLDMLSRNPDMLDFVEGYPEKKGQVFADTIGHVKKGEFPLLLQWDERWGYGNYGNNCIAVNGCAPTVISMVVAGLTGDNSITPYTVAQFADENGYYVPGSGSSWSLISEGIGQFGLSSSELPVSKDSVLGALDSGMPVICSMRPGDFTTTGHFIVLVGTENGQIRVHDPNSQERSRQLWDYETLEHQINNLWAVSPL